MEPKSERNWHGVLVASTVCALGAGILVAHGVRRRRFAEKPQRRFRTVYADNSDTPFRHLARGEANQHSDFVVHPYVHEILALKKESAPYLISDPPSAPSSVPTTWVDTEGQLRTMIQELKGLEVFALDVEFHRQRSYHGFVCLVQIFTGACVYLIDAISLHDELHALNAVFSDPKIRKVLHGCHNDVVWLQQDCRSYLVNIFDTEKACQVLRKPKSNLAYLLETYFRIRTDKSMQQADWRQRPLTEEQRTRELMATVDLYTKAVHKSHDLSLNLFQKMTSQEAATSAALHLIRRYFDAAGKSLHQGDYDLSQEKHFMACVYYLCIWRDAVAREEDESPEFVLKNKLLTRLAREVPASVPELLQCVSEIPLYDYSNSDTTAVCWDPPRAFTERAKEVVRVLAEVTTGAAVWNEGPILLDPSRRGVRWRSKEAVEEARERTVDTFCAKSKVYDNCQMLSLNGELLCYCDRRNLEWYVRKKLATVESEDPFVIRLLFQHQTADQANHAHEFYVQSRINCCVACGEEGHYLRYKIVPACYRKNFPVALKSHRSHDVVLLCIDCHHVAQTASDVLKRKLAQEYGVPLISDGMAQGLDQTIRPAKVRAAALALQNSREKIPAPRLKELEETIHIYFGRDPIQHGPVSPEDLKLALLVGMAKRELKKTIKHDEASGREISVYKLPKSALDSGEEAHGEQVVAKVLQSGGEAELYTLIRRFRQVFVDSLQPKYLPEKWEVDHFAPRQFGADSIFHPTPSSAGREDNR